MRTQNCQVTVAATRAGLPGQLLSRRHRRARRGAQEQLNQPQDFCSRLALAVESGFDFGFAIRRSCTAPVPPATTRHSCQIQLTQPRGDGGVAAPRSLRLLQNSWAWNRRHATGTALPFLPSELAPVARTRVMAQAASSSLTQGENGSAEKTIGKAGRGRPRLLRAHRNQAWHPGPPPAILNWRRQAGYGIRGSRPPTTPAPASIAMVFEAEITVSTESPASPRSAASCSMCWTPAALWIGMARKRESKHQWQAAVVGPPAPRPMATRRLQRTAQRAPGAEAARRQRPPRLPRRPPKAAGSRRGRRRPGSRAEGLREGHGPGRANALGQRRGVLAGHGVLFFLQQTPQQRENVGLLLEALELGKAATPDRLLLRPAQPGDPPAHFALHFPRRGAASLALPFRAAAASGWFDPEGLGLALQVLRSQKRINSASSSLKLGRSTLAAFIPRPGFQAARASLGSRGAATRHRFGSWPQSSWFRTLVEGPKSADLSAFRSDRARSRPPGQNAAAAASASRACVLAIRRFRSRTPAGPSESQVPDRA